MAEVVCINCAQRAYLPVTGRRAVGWSPLFRGNAHLPIAPKFEGMVATDRRSVDIAYDLNKAIHCPLFDVDPFTPLLSAVGHQFARRNLFDIKLVSLRQKCGRYLMLA